MRRTSGFTIIELLIFLVVSAMLANIGIYALRSVSNSLPAAQRALVAVQTARSCMEYYSGQNAKNNYTSIACPSTTVPTFCTAPSGYTLSVNVTCTTVNGDANYKTITVTVGGASAATLSLLIAATS